MDKTDRRTLPWRYVLFVIVEIVVTLTLGITLLRLMFH